MDLISPESNSTGIISTSGLNSTVLAPLAAIANEVDPETCRLLGPVALAVQGLMGFLVLGSLVLKRAQEKPRRKWRVWTADVSKQIIGQAFVHMSNVLISDQIARHKADNPCSLYSLNIVVDCTAGIFVLYGFLRLSTHVMKHYQPTYKPGDYGSPFDISTWATQAAVYVACLTAMKLVVIAIFWIFPDLVRIASYLLSFIHDFDAQVVISMLIIPLVMNVFQFLVVDSMLKSRDTSSDAQTRDDEESRRGFLDSDELFDRDEDDSDDDGGGRTARKHLPVNDSTPKAPTDVDSGYANSTLSKTPGSASGQQTPVPTARRDLDSAGETTSTPMNGLAGTTSYPPRHVIARQSSPTPIIPASRSRGFGPVSRIAPSSTTVSPPKQAVTPIVSEKPATATAAPEPERVSLDGAASNTGTDEGWGVNDWDAGSMNSLDLAREIDAITNEKRGRDSEDWGLGITTVIA